MTKEQQIRANLYIEDEEYDEYWNEWKTDIMNSINKYRELLSNKNYSYCLESDFQFEEDYQSECNNKIKIIANENGLIIYKIERRNEK